MDVTQEVLNNHIVYGASDNTAPGSIAASRSLNYATGATITKPEKQECTAVPRTLNYKGETGLFGVENYFTRVQLRILGDAVFACYEEEGWECALMTERVVEEPFWQKAIIDPNQDTQVINTYEPALTKGNSLPFIPGGGYLSIDLQNLGTNNRYVDDWLDVRLYTEDREEHPFDLMFVKPTDAFYIGFHARNTRRLQYDVSCIIGKQYVAYDSIKNKQYIMRKPYR
mgnify:CR=1 FL=1